ncbi:MAG: HEPN domain-containing protein [Planctomycetes bacterium]|nr:HEPN domain-containing protein [Planctomycetota bacterium]
MADSPEDSVGQWLTKADEDLISAKRLGLDKEPLLGIAMFHCQQAAEKALKAVLAWKGLPLRKTHDLDDLITNAVNYISEMESLRDDAVLLNPYITEYRYPGSGSPDFEEFKDALASAERILNVARKIIGRA